LKNFLKQIKEEEEEEEKPQVKPKIPAGGFNMLAGGVPGASTLEG